MTLHSSHQIYKDFRIIWMPAVFLFLGAAALTQGERAAFQVSFLLATLISTLLIYTLHAEEVHELKAAKSEWAMANRLWVHFLSSLLGWGVLYFFLAYRLNIVCDEPLQMALKYWAMAVKGTDIVLVLIAYLGITGQLPGLIQRIQGGK